MKQREHFHRSGMPGQASRSLKGDSLQAGDETEVFHVQRGHIEAEMQCGGPDDQILNGDGDPSCCLLAFDLPGQLSNGQ
jgi:hypothetical protein